MAGSWPTRWSGSARSGQMAPPRHEPPLSTDHGRRVRGAVLPDPVAGQRRRAGVPGHAQGARVAAGPGRPAQRLRRSRDDPAAGCAVRRKSCRPRGLGGPGPRVRPSGRGVGGSPHDRERHRGRQAGGRPVAAAGRADDPSRRRRGLGHARRGARRVGLSEPRQPDPGVPRDHPGDRHATHRRVAVRRISGGGGLVPRDRQRRRRRRGRPVRVAAVAADRALAPAERHALVGHPRAAAHVAGARRSGAGLDVGERLPGPDHRVRGVPVHGHRGDVQERRHPGHGPVDQPLREGAGQHPALHLVDRAADLLRRLQQLHHRRHDDAAARGQEPGQPREDRLHRRLDRCAHRGAVDLLDVDRLRDHPGPGRR